MPVTLTVSTPSSDIFFHFDLSDWAAWQAAITIAEINTMPRHTWCIWMYVCMRIIDRPFDIVKQGWKEREMRLYNTWMGQLFSCQLLKNPKNRIEKYRKKINKFIYRNVEVKCYWARSDFDTFPCNNNNETNENPLESRRKLDRNLLCSCHNETNLSGIHAKAIVNRFRFFN